MNYLSNFLTALLCVFGFAIANAQNPYQPIENLQLFLKHTGNNYKNTPNKAVEDSDTMYVVCTFKVKDWKDISKFYIKVGTPLNEGKKADLTINVKNPGTLPKGVSYRVNKDRVNIVLGGYKEMQKYVATVVVENTFGSRSDALKVEKNQ
jgi:hypothetical protein